MTTDNNQNLTDGMHIVGKALKVNGIKEVFGVVGIPVTDLARHLQEIGIRFIGFRHEQSAGNAAAISGYLNKFPGICLTVSAPGFLNGLTALANATTNGFPMIMISGSSNRAIIDLQQGDYEEMDQMNIAKPFCKASYRINRPEDISIGVARAIRSALSGRPGGVYLDLTTALLASTLDQGLADKSQFCVVDPDPMILPSGDSIARAMSLLGEAKQPLIILGKGAAYSQCDEQIKDFIDQTGIPYLPMSMAKGLIPDNHPLCCEAARGYVLENADVVMLVGARLNWLLSHGKGKHWNENVRFIQLDIEGKEMDSNRPIAAPVVGDIKASIQLMLNAVKEKPITTAKGWTDAIAAVKSVNDNKMAEKLNNVTNPMNFFCALKSVRDVLANYKDIYVVNEGANTLDDGRNVLDMHEPRHRLDCGTWGVMGIGMGYAIGAAISMGKQVVCIEGDSAFGFS